MIMLLILALQGWQLLREAFFDYESEQSNIEPRCKRRCLVLSFDGHRGNIHDSRLVFDVTNYVE